MSIKPPNGLSYSNVKPPSLDRVVGDGVSEQIDMVQATAPHMGPFRPFGPAPNYNTNPESGKGEC